jgi:hypothetical protein
VLAGCGGSGSGGRGPSRAAFVAQADALCAPELKQLRDVRAQLDKAAGGGDPNVIFRRSAQLLREGAATTRATFDRIEALDRPPADRERVAAWIAAVRRQTAMTVALSGAFDRQDDARIAQLSGRIDAMADVNSGLARTLGLRACARRAER